MDQGHLASGAEGSLAPLVWGPCCPQPISILYPIIADTHVTSGLTIPLFVVEALEGPWEHREKARPSLLGGPWEEHWPPRLSSRASWEMASGWDSLTLAQRPLAQPVT